MREFIIAQILGAIGAVFGIIATQMKNKKSTYYFLQWQIYFL